LTLGYVGTPVSAFTNQSAAHVNVVLKSNQLHLRFTCIDYAPKKRHSAQFAQCTASILLVFLQFKKKNFFWYLLFVLFSFWFENITAY